MVLDLEIEYLRGSHYQTRDYLLASSLEYFKSLSLSHRTMNDDNISKYGKSANDTNADPFVLEATTSNVQGTCVETDNLKREFKERHVSMIAVAGAIGTGLIIGSGTGLVRGGPASLLIAYSIIGAVVFFNMTAVGEMATMLPSDKGFAGYATRFVDPALG